MQERRLSAFSGVCSARGAENGAVQRVRVFAADRVADVVPHNPKVTASTAPRDVWYRLLPSHVVLYGIEDSNMARSAVVKMNLGSTTRRSATGFPTFLARVAVVVADYASGEARLTSISMNPIDLGEGLD